MAYPIPPDQLQAMRELFDQKVPNREIAERFGVPLGSVNAQKAVWSWLKHREVASESSAVEDAISTTFGLERDLQKALRANIQQLERGLQIIDTGKERGVTSGRIDILAKDNSGQTVVIELKAGEADRDAIGQILAYMGDLADESDTPIRGILVAGAFSVSALAASRAVPNLQLKKYQFRFTFESASRPKPA